MAITFSIVSILLLLAGLAALAYSSGPRAGAPVLLILFGLSALVALALTLWG